MFEMDPSVGADSPCARDDLVDTESVASERYSATESDASDTEEEERLGEEEDAAVPCGGKGERGRGPLSLLTLDFADRRWGIDAGRRQVAKDLAILGGNKEMLQVCCTEGRLMLRGTLS